MMGSKRFAKSLRFSRGLAASSIGSLRQHQSNLTRGVLNRMVSPTDNDSRRRQMEEYSQIHPECEEFEPFFYVPGRPDRVQKVIRFMAEQETNIKANAEREQLEQLLQSQNKGTQDNTPREKFYYNSIKNRVPKPKKTEQALKRELKMQQGGYLKAKGSGNLAKAIGLYKSGVNIEQLANIRKQASLFLQKNVSSASSGSQNV